MIYKYCDNKKTGGIENIIKINVDSLLFEDKNLTQNVINKIKELRLMVKYEDGFQFLQLVKEKE